MIHRLPPAGREALANALHPAFLLAAGVCGLVFVISVLWVREVPLRHGFEDVDRGRRGLSATSGSKIRVVSSNDFMPLDGWDHVEFWVGNAKQAAYFYEHALGFTPTAYAGPETGVRDRASYVLEQGDIRFVLTSGLSGDSEVGQFAARHGDGAKDVALQVPSAGDAYREAVERGARGVKEPHWVEDDYGRVELASIATYGDTIHTFVNRREYAGPVPARLRARRPANGHAGTGVGLKRSTTSSATSSSAR